MSEILHNPQTDVKGDFACGENDHTGDFCHDGSVQNRLREIRKSKGREWTLEYVAREIAAAFPKEYANREPPAASDISRLERGEIPLSESWLAKFAKVLDTPISAIIGESALRPTVPLVGYVGAGDLYYPDPLSGPWVGFDVVEAPPGSEPGLVAVRVRGDSMNPVFRNGDLLYFSKDDRVSPTELVGEDCIVQVRNGPTFIKILERGSKPGRYRLRSYNESIGDIDNAEIEWAVPVRYIARSRNTK